MAPSFGHSGHQFELHWFLEQQPNLQFRLTDNICKKKYKYVDGFVIQAYFCPPSGLFIQRMNLRFFFLVSASTLHILLTLKSKHVCMMRRHPSESMFSSFFNLRAFYCAGGGCVNFAVWNWQKLCSVIVGCKGRRHNIWECGIKRNGFFYRCVISPLQRTKLCATNELVQAIPPSVLSSIGISLGVFPI